MIKFASRASFAIIACVLLSGCITAQSYVDSALPKAGKEDLRVTAQPQPIQVIYEFRTRGAANAAGTETTSGAVLDTLRASGLFSEVASAPVPSQRRLVITIENVPVTSHEDAMAKGFGTGLTFGLIGTMVTDGYVCEAAYTAPGSEPVKLSYRHALHTTIGNASGPPGLTPRRPVDAVKEIASQLTWSILRDLSRAHRI